MSARTETGDLAPPGGFRLLRYFSIACLIALIIAVIGLGVFFRQTALSRLVKVGEDNNVSVAKVFANTLAPRYLPLIDAASRMDAARIRATSQGTALHRAVLEAVRDTNVVRVAIYDPSGRAVYSSDPAPAASDAVADAGIAAARARGVKSALYAPATFDAFGETLRKRELLVSHVPVRAPNSTDVDAVFELYSDVTPFFDDIRLTQQKLRLGATLVMILLYAALFLIAKRADNIIRRHEAQRQRDEETIRHLAHHDSLTDLPNRKLFSDRLESAIARAKRYQGISALMFIDLDRFKEINDTLGHAVGDRVLKAAAKRLRTLLREIDTVGRLGGDEFTIVLQDVADAAHAATVAEKIREAFATPIMSEDGVDHFITPSIGIALYPRDAENADGLLDAADSAMYAAKAAGGNTYRFYEAGATEPDAARVERAAADIARA